MDQTIEKSLSFEPILKEKVKQKLINKANDDVHQAIMDVAYEEYKAYLEDINRQLELEHRPVVRWYYSGLCEWVRHQLGDLAEFAVLIGKYNQQVENGGHSQYWQNGYGSVDNIYEDIYLHMYLIEYFEQMSEEISLFYKEDEIMNISSTLGRVLDILKRFPESVEWVVETITAGFDTEGIRERRDPEDDYKELTDWSSRQLDYLDEQYYKVNKALMDILNLYFYNYLN